MNNEIVDVICSALKSDSSLDELVTKLGDVKTRIRRGKLFLSEEIEQVEQLEKIEAIIEQMILRGFYQQHDKVSRKPKLKIIK